MLAWLLVFLISCAAPILHLVRHRGRGSGVGGWAGGIVAALQAPVGAGFMLGLVMAYIGLAEKTWSWSSTELWMLVLLGVLGIPLQIIGWRAALRPALRPGQCLACGYAMQGLASCPECGPQAQTQAQSAALPSAATKDS